MIKINLVPVKEKKKRKELIIIFWVVAFLVVVALGMTWIYIQRKAVETDLINHIRSCNQSQHWEKRHISRLHYHSCCWSPSSHQYLHTV